MTRRATPKSTTTDPVSHFVPSHQTRRTPVPATVYEVDLEPLLGDQDPGPWTCCHRHPSLDEAWRCSLWHDLEDPFDIVAIHNGAEVARWPGSDYHGEVDAS